VSNKEKKKKQRKKDKNPRKSKKSLKLLHEKTEICHGFCKKKIDESYKNRKDF